MTAPASPAVVATPDPWLRRHAIPLLALALVATALVASSLGAARASLLDVLAALSHSAARDEATLRLMLDVRLPRVALAVLVGAALASSGAALQGIFRNPLADPGLVGASSGAALAAALSLLARHELPATWLPVFDTLGLPGAAFLGALGASLLALGLGQRGGATDLGALLLAGIALGALASAVIGALVLVAGDSQLRSFVFWNLGSLNGARWTSVAALAGALLLALPALLGAGRALDALLLGEAAAVHLGVTPDATKRRVVVAASLATGAAVAFVGIVGFVGLIAPHLGRAWVGPLHRTLLPVSCLLGAVLVLTADALGRVVIAPAELPLGVVTALAGAPLFLALLSRRRRWEAA